MAASLPARDSRRRGCLAGLAPASPTLAPLCRSRSARDPYGNRPPPALVRAGPLRPQASLPDPAAVLGAARGPGGRLSGPERSCAWPSAPGEEACKIANSSRSWKTQLRQSAAKTAALGAAPLHAPLPTPTSLAACTTRGDNCDLLLRGCKRLEGSLCVCPGQCCSSW